MTKVGRDRSVFEAMAWVMDESDGFAVWVGWRVIQAGRLSMERGEVEGLDM